jgi:monofunctional glycosyltransferase
MARPLPVPVLRRVRQGRLARWVLRVVILLLLAPPALIVALRFVPPPITSLMVLRLVEGFGLHKQWVPYRRIAPVIAASVIASEDDRFCSEPLGFDAPAIYRQVVDWRHGERPRGASTITMQLARNLFLWPGRDLLRKAIEAWLTPQLALLLPKQRVIELYLNVVEFGPGLYGVQAAAEHYFDRSAEALTPEQAAELTALLPDPLHWSLARPQPIVRERTGIILHRAEGLGPLVSCVR